MNSLSAEELLKVESVVDSVFGKALHQKRCLSLSYAAMGLLASESLILHRMGEGLSETLGGNKKHTTKQIDRLLSNKKIDIWTLSSYWAQHMLSDVKEVMVALDWSSFADDKQSMLSLNMVSSKGLSVPLLWKSVDNSRIKYNRGRYELLSRLKEVLPEGVKVSVLADRGFSDQKFLRFLTEELQFNFVIRIKSNTTIIHDGIKLKASERLEKGKIASIKQAGITLNNYPVKVFIATQDKSMKAPWYLVSNLSNPASEIIKTYSKRWKIGVSRLRTLHLVGASPTEVKDSSLVAREAWWRESKPMEPSDNLFKGIGAIHQAVM